MNSYVYCTVPHASLLVLWTLTFGNQEVERPKSRKFKLDSWTQHRHNSLRNWQIFANLQQYKEVSDAPEKIRGPELELAGHRHSIFNLIASSYLLEYLIAS